MNVLSVLVEYLVLIIGVVFSLVLITYTFNVISYRPLAFDKHLYK
jgi:hypothetical protein